MVTYWYPIGLNKMLWAAGLYYSWQYFVKNQKKNKVRGHFDLAIKHWFHLSKDFLCTEELYMYVYQWTFCSLLLEYSLAQFRQHCFLAFPNACNCPNLTFTCAKQMSNCVYNTLWKHSYFRSMALGLASTFNLIFIDLQENLSELLPWYIYSIFEILLPEVARFHQFISTVPPFVEGRLPRETIQTLIKSLLNIFLCLQLALFSNYIYLSLHWWYENRKALFWKLTSLSTWDEKHPVQFSQDQLPVKEWIPKRLIYKSMSKQVNECYYASA